MACATLQAAVMLRAVAIALVLALAAAGVQTWRLLHLQAAVATERQHIATAREQAMHAALIETTRRLAAHQEAADAAQTRARRARADAASAGAAADRLRQHVATLAAGACASDPAAAAVGAAASAPGLVLADLLGRLEARGRDLAAEADRRGIAGDECAGRYDALNAGPPGR